MRNQDVPKCVLEGGADAGIIGRDIIMETDYDLTVPLDLNIGTCRLSVASLAENAENILQRSHLKVATKYPRLASDFFYNCGISCDIINLNGSIEIAPILEISDCIVDLVSTGRTLKENGLVEVHKIHDFSAALIVSRATYALQNSYLQLLLSKIQAYYAGIR